MSTLAIHSLLWAIVLLIAIPWFLLAALPFLVLPFVVAGLGAAPVLATGAVWVAVRQRRREASRHPMEAPAHAPPVRIFLPKDVGLSPHQIQAVLREFDPRIGDGVQACACLLVSGGRALLTVKILEPDRCICRRVQGATPGEALERLHEKLLGREARRRGGTRRRKSPERECCPSLEACPARTVPAFA